VAGAGDTLVGAASAITGSLVHAAWSLFVAFMRVSNMEIDPRTLFQVPSAHLKFSLHY